MLLDVAQYSGLFAKLVEAAKGSLKRLIVSNSDARQLDTPPFWCLLKITAGTTVGELSPHPGIVPLYIGKIHTLIQLSTTIAE